METSFANYIRDDNVLFKYAKGIGAKRGLEFHKTHEIVFFIGGEAEFYSENIHTKLLAGNVIVIPKEKYHQIKIIGNESDYHRAVFSFYDIPEFNEFLKKDMHVVFVIEAAVKLHSMLEKVINALKNSQYTDSAKVLIMRSYLTLIMAELSMQIACPQKSINTDLLTLKCLDYINDNLCNKLLIPEIANQLNVSVSTLTQTFKRDMNIALHKYILRKRLVLAQQMITEGCPASIVSVKCGFNDYSGFYRQYKKMFGITPSQETIPSVSTVFTYV